MEQEPSCKVRLYCDIGKFQGCGTLAALLEISAQACGTRFEVIDTGPTLEATIAKYVVRGEPAFAILEQEFLRGVLGVTLRLQAARPWELPFVSVIDVRGDRRKRSYFTKWHEVAHLLLLTNERRPSFHRTHTPRTEEDPEEALVDLVAGQCGFHRALKLARAELIKESSKKKQNVRDRSRGCSTRSGPRAPFSVTHANSKRFPHWTVGFAIGSSLNEHSEKAVGKYRGANGTSAAQGITTSVPRPIPRRTVVLHYSRVLAGERRRCSSAPT